LQKYHGGKTKVMASGLRTKAEALALAGCDFLVVVSAWLVDLDLPDMAGLS